MKKSINPFYMLILACNLLIIIACGSSDGAYSSRDFSSGKQDNRRNNSGDATPDLLSGYWRADISFETAGYNKKNFYAYIDQQKISFYIICRMKDQPNFFKQIDKKIIVSSKKIRVIDLPPPSLFSEQYGIAKANNTSDESSYDDCNIEIPSFEVDYSYDDDQKIYSMKINKFILLRWSKTTYEEIFLE